jgi:Ca2+-binding RTX toxin-like protein
MMRRLVLLTAMGLLGAGTIVLPVSGALSGIPDPNECHGVPVTITVNDDGAPLGPGNDVVFGTSGRDVINTLDGRDHVTAAGGRDRICGGPDKDHLEGEPGNDVVFGDKGNDVGSQANHQGPRVIGGAGKDILHGGDGRDLLRGNPGGDTLKGEKGNDLLDGGQDRDVCFGGPGSDRAVDSQACDVKHSVP